MSTQTLYARLGGAAAVDAAVPLFYARVLADARLLPFFAGIPMDRLERHQRQFLTYAFGGPNQYSGRGLSAAHRRLVTDMGLTDGHFDAVVGHLAATLRELGVAEPLIGEVAAVAESVRGQILHQPAG